MNKTMKFTPMMAALILLADKHQQAGEYIAGSYWNVNTHTGCAIGCTIADAKTLGIVNGVDYGNHAGLAAATGIPEMLLRLADHIFEGLPDHHRSAWTPQFLRAVSKSNNLQSAPARIMSALARKLSDDAIRDDVRDVTLVVAGLWNRRADGDEPATSEWDAAREQAYAAWEQADAALEQADAARKQADAAREQADAAWEQADAARKQADAAWEQADAARKQADAALEQADAAREQFWLWCADTVVAILIGKGASNANVPNA